MRVLLIESEPEDVVFLRDALTEIGEGRFWSNWVNMEVLEAPSWNKASAILASEPVDIVLLDLEIVDSQGMETFRRAQRVAAHIPIVVLVGASEEMLGPRLVRDGAQDFLVKKQIDCAPLAHAMRNAIERHRLLSAARAASTHDTLTGLLNRGGFLTSTGRDLKLAQRLNLRLMVIVAEIPSAYAEQQRDLALVEAADHLRSVAGPADVLAHIEPTRFGMTIFDSEAESLEAASARIRAAMRQHHIQTGAAIFSPKHPATLDTLLEQAATNLTHADVAHALMRATSPLVAPL
jgi:PleD family two-component response regulator